MTNDKKQLERIAAARQLYAVLKEYLDRPIWTPIEGALSVQPFSERRYLAADGGFKKKILEEMPEEVVLTLAIREYLQCIGNLHMLVRSYVADRVLKSRQLISTQISRYAGENNGATIGLAAFRLDSKGKQESLPLFLDWDDVREKLVSRNSGLVSLGRHVVTGRAK